MSDATAAAPPPARADGAGDAEAGRLDQAREQWRAGDWSALARIVDEPVETHPDRARLALLAAAGLAQAGRMAETRLWVLRARDWGCPDALIARLLLSGACSSLGRAALLLDDDAHAMALFEQALAIVEPQAETAVRGRIRKLHEWVRIGRLPEAVDLLREEVENAPPAALVAADTRRILVSSVKMMQQELALMQKRGQLTDPADDAVDRRTMSQLGQDVWVLDQTGHRRGGFFVEFGATDGVRLSNTYLLETGYGWNGICAEPNPDYFARLERNRTCRLSRDCILGETGREVEFILAEEFGGVAEYGAGDQHSDLRETYRRQGGVLRLTSISLHDFLVKHGAPRRIDYLSIDTEGSEYDILAAFPFETWEIALITVEHNFSADRERIRELLTAQGYERQEAQWDDWYRRPDLLDPARSPTETGPDTAETA